jgi:hypothetical protein
MELGRAQMGSSKLGTRKLENWKKLKPGNWET